MNLKALKLKDKNGKAFGQEMYNVAEESKIREVTCVIYEVMEMKANQPIGSQGHALRRQAHNLRGLQGDWLIFSHDTARLGSLYLGQPL